MRGSRLITAVGAAFVLISLSGCAASASSLDSALVQDGASAVLTIADVIPDGADGLMLVCPYATVDSLAELSSRDRESFSLRDAQLPGDDDSALALLRTDGHTVEFFDSSPRKPIDLCNGGFVSGDEFTASDRLDLVSTDAGETWGLEGGRTSSDTSMEH